MLRKSQDVYLELYPRSRYVHTRSECLLGFLSGAMCLSCCFPASSASSCWNNLPISDIRTVAHCAVYVLSFALSLIFNLTSLSLPDYYLLTWRSVTADSVTLLYPGFCKRKHVCLMFCKIDFTSTTTWSPFYVFAFQMTHVVDKVLVLSQNELWINLLSVIINGQVN